MNRLKKAAKTRLKQIKKEVRLLAREAKGIARLFGKRKPRKARKAKAVVAKPRRARKKKATPPVAVAA